MKGGVGFPADVFFSFFFLLLRLFRGLQGGGHFWISQILVLPFPPSVCTFSIFFLGGGERGFLYRNWNLSLGAGFTFVHGVAGGRCESGNDWGKGGCFPFDFGIKKLLKFIIWFKKILTFCRGSVAGACWGCPFIMLLPSLFFDFMTQREWMYWWMTQGVVWSEGAMHAYSSRSVIKRQNLPHVFFVSDARWASINSLCIKALSLSLSPSHVYIYMYLCIHFCCMPCLFLQKKKNFGV